MQRKSFIITLLLAIILGCFGVHRFYTGYKKEGFIQLFTFGALGAWQAIDIIAICFNKYKDANNKELLNYNKNIAAAALIVCTVFTVMYAIKLQIVINEVLNSLIY